MPELRGTSQTQGGQRQLHSSAARPGNAAGQNRGYLGRERGEQVLFPNPHLQSEVCQSPSVSLSCPTGHQWVCVAVLGRQILPGTAARATKIRRFSASRRWPTRAAAGGSVSSFALIQVTFFFSHKEHFSPFRGWRTSSDFYLFIYLPPLTLTEAQSSIFTP